MFLRAFLGLNFKREFFEGIFRFNFKESFLRVFLGLILK